MKLSLKLEEFAMFALGAYAFSTLSISWWWFFGLLFLPDIGMLGYAFGNTAGAMVYNVFHHKGLAIFIFTIGIYTQIPWLKLIGIILFTHASLDRMLGYGLKYKKGFKFTHLENL